MTTTRTPIASIRGHAEPLLMEMEEEEGGNAPDPAELRDYLNIVYREAERLSALVEDLLSLARIDSDELHLDVAPIVASEVVEEVYATMAPLARRERQVTLIRKVAPMLPLILADRQRLVQVLLNLLRNAITYTPQGGLLASHPGRAFSREFLLQHLWGYDYDGFDRTVDTHMTRLRKKRGPVGEKIVTVWSVGYRFVV